jgi:hypothetical protein
MGNMNDNIGPDGEALWKPGYTRRAFLGVGLLCGAAYLGQPLLRKVRQSYVGGMRNEYDWDKIAAPMSADYRKFNQDMSPNILSLHQLTDVSTKPEFDRGLKNPDGMRKVIAKIQDGKLDGKLERIVLQGDYLGFKVSETPKSTTMYYAKVAPELRKKLGGY